MGCIMDTIDLLGMPVVPPQAPSKGRKLLANLGELLERRAAKHEAGKKRLMKYLEESSTAPLFDDLFDTLTKALVRVNLPAAYVSDIADVAPAAEESLEVESDLVAIPHVSWGAPLVIDANGFGWSKEGLVYLQTKLLWRSFEELMLEHNPMDKWDALKWIFRPLVWKDYLWDQNAGRSVCIETHQRTLPFSFHNCCLAAGMDGDVLREGVRRNLPTDVLNAVERVCRFD